MRQALLGFTAALSLSASACASLPTLLTAHRFDEAVCSVDDGSAVRHDDPSLMLAIEAELHPTVQIHAVTPAEVDALFADADSALRAHAREEARRVVIVRTRIGTQGGAVERAWLQASIRRGGQPITPVPTGEQLTAFFHETVPKSHEVGPGVAGTVVAWGRDVGANPVANALTLGLWSALNGPSATSTTVAPTQEDFLRTAPISTRLSTAFPSHYCEEKTGASCEYSSIFERPAGDDRAPFTVRVEMTATAAEGGGVFSSLRFCTANRVVEVSLPPGPTLEERFAARFGEGPHSLSDLAR